MESTVHQLKQRMINAEKEIEAAYQRATWSDERADRAYSKAEMAIDIVKESK